MTEPFVGRCNSTFDGRKRPDEEMAELYYEILHLDISNANLLVDLAKDPQSDTFLRCQAMYALIGLNDNHDGQLRDKFLALVDEILTYDENGIPLEKDEIVRAWAFKFGASLYTEADFYIWRKRVHKDPSRRMQFLSHISY